MKIAKTTIRKYCEAELDTLKGVIDYAERMIFQQGDVEYRTLRRHAYGKTVVIETKKKGTQVFRLSSTALTYPNFASGYATPHSPVGRLCSFLQHDDEDENPLWGEYRVIETRLFDRFDGLRFEENVRNFLRMIVQGDKGRDTVLDLVRTFRNESPVSLEEVELPKIPHAPLEPKPVQGWEKQPPEIQAISPPASIQLAHLEVDEEEQIEDLPAAVELDEPEDAAEIGTPLGDEYYGLSEVFFINRTKEQDQVIARSPVGPMFVEGVAGSGKTSAALGRTKMLCSFNEAAVSDEGEFRNVAGARQDYWSGKYAGRFTQEGSIGFVRTGELIQYLKETCRRIDLPHLPVAEYRELQVRLRQHRRIELSRLPGGRWKLLRSSRNSEIDTTMQWLRAADRSVARLMANQLPANLPSAEDLISVFDEDFRAGLRPIASIVCGHVKEAIKPMLTVMAHAPSTGRFGLNQIAVHLAQLMGETRSRILGRDVLWYLGADEAFYAENEEGMASLFFRKKLALFSRSSSRLVFVDGGQPVDRRLRLMTFDGQDVTWNEETAELLSKGKLAVADQDGQVFPAQMADRNALHRSLLPESIDKIYVLRSGKLKALALKRGLGRSKYSLARIADEEPAEDPDDRSDEVTETGEADQPEDTTQRVASLDTIFRRVFQKLVLQPFAYFADAYSESLVHDSASYPDPTLAKEIANQMSGKSLTGEDVDLVLCLAHMIGRGFSGNPGALRDPSFYQSVFIDEVQDFTEQQVFLMAEQAKPEYRAVTVVGDIAQKLHHGNQFDICACFPSIDVAHVRLTDNLRQMEVPALAWFSACFRSEFQDGLAGNALAGMLKQKIKMDMDTMTEPELRRYATEGDMDALIIQALKRVPRSQTAAIVLPDNDSALRIHQRLQPVLTTEFIETELSEKVDLSRRHLRHFTSVLNAKGLEFDVVILPMIDLYDLENKSHVNRLYVGLTRARRKLVMLAPTEFISPRLDEVWARYSESIAELLVETL